MSVANLKNRFDKLLVNLNSSSVSQFSKTVESAYEALVLAAVMTEYKRLKGAIISVTLPTAGSFLNQGPGKFRPGKAFKIEFQSAPNYYFAADVEIYGLSAREQNAPVGIRFEADVIVFEDIHETDIINNFNGYPAPQHLDSIYECKYGQYSKSQLRELLGLRRHVSYLQGRSFTHAPNHVATELFGFENLNCHPCIPVKMARPRLMDFFDNTTASLFDLHQIDI